jgi:hypothetical protein
MQEQIAILVLHQHEWVLVIDSDEDEPERSWKSLYAAMDELRRDSWQVVHGPAPISIEMPGLERFDQVGYRLRRGIQ